MTLMDAGNAADREAAAWVAREDRGPLSLADQTARDTWLQADRRHLGAYARAHAVFAALSRAQALAPARDLRPSRRPRRVWAAAIAAGIAICTLGVTLTLSHWPVTHASGSSEIAEIVLPDGSRMVLNADSDARVQFDSERRQVVLLRGEALFDVRKDPAREFVVVAGRNRVVAIGTVFSVQRGVGDEIQVVVREGIVDVDGDDLARPVRVAANFRVQAQPGAGVDLQPLQAAEVDRRLAWSHGMLAFEGDTLAQAAAQFARYSDVRILIDEPRIAQRRVAGLYAADDPDGFARAVAASLGLRVERDSRGIHLRDRMSSPPPANALPTDYQ